MSEDLQNVMKAYLYNACVVQTDIRSLDLIALSTVQEGVRESKKRNFVPFSKNKEWTGKEMFD